MTHYVCSGDCHGVSDVPKNCGAKTCSRYDHPLVPCNCMDGKHAGIMTACHNCGKLCKETGGCVVEEYKEELGK